MIKGVTETIRNKSKEQKGDLLSMLLVILGASLLGTLLTGNGVKRLNCSNIPGQGVMRAGECTNRSSQNF